MMQLAERVGFEIAVRWCLVNGGVFSIRSDGIELGGLMRSCPPSQTVHLSTLLCALDRAASLGARNREAVRAGDMGKGLALI